MLFAEGTPLLARPHANAPVSARQRHEDGSLPARRRRAAPVLRHRGTRGGARHRLRLRVRQGVHRRARPDAHIDRHQRDLEAQVHRRGGLHRRRSMARRGGHELQREVPRAGLHQAPGPARQGYIRGLLRRLPRQVQASVQGCQRRRARHRAHRLRDGRRIRRRGARRHDHAVRHEDRRGHGQGPDQGARTAVEPDLHREPTGQRPRPCRFSHVFPRSSSD